MSRVLLCLTVFVIAACEFSSETRSTSIQQNSEDAVSCTELQQAVGKGGGPAYVFISEAQFLAGDTCDTKYDINGILSNGILTQRAHMYYVQGNCSPIGTMFFVLREVQSRNICDIPFSMYEVYQYDQLNTDTQPILYIFLPAVTLQNGLSFLPPQGFPLGFGVKKTAYAGTFPYWG